jgi:hypothetical protein
MKVKFLKDYEPFSAGDIVGIAEETAKCLIEAGYCEPVEVKTAKVEPVKPKK